MANVSDYCRCCLSSSNFMFDMNTILQDNEGISTYFNIYLALITPDEALNLADSPPLTCQECSLKLETVYEFSKSCQQANRILINKHMETVPADADPAEVNTEIKQEHYTIIQVPNADVSTEELSAEPHQAQSENASEECADSGEQVDIKSIYLCDTCERSFSSKSDLEHHEFEHILEMFSCSLCTFTCRQEDDMKEHFLNQHKIVYNGDKHRKTVSSEWESQGQCNQVVMQPLFDQNDQSVEMHDVMVATHSFDTHNHNQTIIPEYSLESTAEQQPEVTDLLSDDEENPTADQEVSTITAMPTPTTLYKEKKRRNKKKDTVVYGHSCSICQKQFKARNLLKSHVKRVHFQSLNCKICQRKFGEKCHMVAHAFTHLSFSAHKCSECNFEHNYKINMSKHLMDKHCMAYDSSLHAYQGRMSPINEIIENCEKPEHEFEITQVLNGKPATKNPTNEGPPPTTREEVEVAMETNEEPVQCEVTNNFSLGKMQVTPTSRHSPVPVYVISNVLLQPSNQTFELTNLNTTTAQSYIQYDPTVSATTEVLKEPAPPYDKVINLDSDDEENQVMVDTTTDT